MVWFLLFLSPRLLLTTLFVGEAFKPEDGAGPLLAGLKQVEDGLAYALSYGGPSRLPEALIRLGVLLVGAHLKGESEKGHAAGLKGRRAAGHTPTKLRPGLRDLIERDPLRTDRRG